MSLTVEALENGDIESWLFAYIHGQPCADPSAVETARLALYNLRFTIQSRAARVQECMRALAELSGAAGLMLAEIDTCGHEVDPAYRTTLYEAWEKSKPLIAATPQPPKPAGAVPTLDSVLRERGLPTVADALGYSRNYAEAAPHLTQTGKDHILGLCNMLEIAAQHPPAAGRADAVPAGCVADMPNFQRWNMARGSDGAQWSVYMDHAGKGEWVKWEHVQQWFFAANLPQQPAAEQACICDGAAYAPNQRHPFIVNKACPKHAEPAAVNQPMTTQGETYCPWGWTLIDNARHKIQWTNLQHVADEWRSDPRNIVQQSYYRVPEADGAGREAVAHIDKEGGSWEIIGIPKAIYRLPDGHHRIYTRPSPVADAEALAKFTEWLVREMPPGTTISDPRWWAPRIARHLKDAAHD